MSNQEIIRHKQFCQIVKEIRKSNEYLIVGIDVAKDKHHAFMGTATGKSLLRKLIFENNIDCFSRLLKTVDAIKIQNGLSKIVYGLEPTGNYHKPLAGHLSVVTVMLCWLPARLSNTTGSFWMDAGIKRYKRCSQYCRHGFQGKMPLL